MDECKPFIEYKSRELLFREGVISFLGISEADPVQDKFCEVCKAAKMDKDCSTCSKKFEVVGDEAKALATKVTGHA